jgi:hypothetical protein
LLNKPVINCITGSTISGLNNTILTTKPTANKNTPPKNEAKLPVNKFLPIQYSIPNGKSITNINYEN